MVENTLAIQELAFAMNDFISKLLANPQRSYQSFSDDECKELVDALSVFDGQDYDHLTHYLAGFMVRHKNPNDLFRFNRHDDNYSLDYAAGFFQQVSMSLYYYA